MAVSEPNLRVLPTPIFTFPNPSCGNGKVIKQIAGDYPEFFIKKKETASIDGFKLDRELKLCGARATKLEELLKPESIKKDRIQAVVIAALGIALIAATIFGFISFGAYGLIPLMAFFILEITCTFLWFGREDGQPYEYPVVPIAWLGNIHSLLTRRSRLKDQQTKSLKELESLTPQIEKFLKESQAFYAKNGQTILKKLDADISQKTSVKRSDLEELKRVKAKAQEVIDFFKPFEGKDISLEFLETSPYYQIITEEGKSL